MYLGNTSTYNFLLCMKNKIIYNLSLIYLLLLLNLVELEVTKENSISPNRSDSNIGEL